MRIEICGGIASGKTTLCQALGKIGFPGVFEKFRENPFWREFYNAPLEYAFETEITFLLQHYSQLKAAVRHADLVVCDFALIMDDSYASLNLKGQKWRVFRSVFEEVLLELGEPDMVVRLDCAKEIEYERIRARGRLEESSIGVRYLEAINENIRERFEHLPDAVQRLEINSGVVDFAHDLGACAKVCNEVISGLRR